MPLNGTDFLVLVDTGGGNFVVAGSQTNASFSETTAVIDQSNKVDGRERKVAGGRYEATISFDALFVPSDAAFAALKAAMRAGTLIKIRTQELGVAKEEMNAIITDMTRDFPDQDNATISLEAAVDGPITVL